MNIKSITIRKPGYYAWERKDKGAEPFLAQIEVESPYGEVRLNIDADRTKAIVALIADLIAEAGKQTAEAMTAEVINGTPLIDAPSVEAA